MTALVRALKNNFTIQELKRAFKYIRARGDFVHATQTRTSDGKYSSNLVCSLDLAWSVVFVSAFARSTHRAPESVALGIDVRVFVPTLHSITHSSRACSAWRWQVEASNEPQFKSGALDVKTTEAIRSKLYPILVALKPTTGVHGVNNVDEIWSNKWTYFVYSGAVLKGMDDVVSFIALSGVFALAKRLARAFIAERRPSAELELFDQRFPSDSVLPRAFSAILYEPGTIAGCTRHTDDVYLCSVVILRWLLMNRILSVYCNSSLLTNRLVRSCLPLATLSFLQSWHTKCLVASVAKCALPWICSSNCACSRAQINSSFKLFGPFSRRARNQPSKARHTRGDTNNSGMRLQWSPDRE
jgi:hypothetical protein